MVLETLDLVVVGAGVFGLAAAKTFKQLNPDRSLAILEVNSSIGGTWSKKRLYPGLKTNNMLGTYEYPDFPMDTEKFGVKPGEHIPGPVLHQYLASYAEAFGIADKIRYETKVQTAQHHDGPEGGWTLTINHGDGESRIYAKKLIVACGVTSEPFLPDLKGQDEFGGLLFHNKDFVDHTDTLDSAESVTVFGGTKSAWDIVYAYGSKGIKVDWVIRESGHGPIWNSPPYATPLKIWLEKLVHTRLLTWFSPCIWGEADGYAGIRSFWHGTKIGRAITSIFWGILGADTIAQAKYDKHPETKKLKPWCEAKHAAASFSILNYPTDILELVRNGTVKVHIADITHLSPNQVHLSNGTTLETELLCCVTGWKHVPAIKFLPEGIEKELGMPHLPDNQSEPIFTDERVRKADEELFSRFPALKDQPVLKKFKPLVDNKAVTTTDKTNPSAPLTPYTLYRFMVPPSARFLATRDIAFAGVLLNITTTITAHVQAVWINAYFTDQLSVKTLPRAADTLNTTNEALDGQPGDGTVKRKTIDEIRYETILHARSLKWRYPAGHGAQFPDFVFDAVPYIDLLLGDLGLKIYRKNGWLAEATQPYGPDDYKDLVQEFASTTRA